MRLNHGTQDFMQVWTVVTAPGRSRLACARLRGGERTQRAFFSLATEMTPWHAASGAFPFEVLTIINETVSLYELPPVKKRVVTYQAENVRLRQEVDRLNALVDDYKLVAAVCELDPQRQQRQFDYTRSNRPQSSCKQPSTRRSRCMSRCGRSSCRS